MERDSNPPMRNADIQDDSSMNSDPAGFSFEPKKSNYKKTSTQIDSSKNKRFD